MPAGPRLTLPPGCPLTPPEYAALIGLAAGLTYQQIADERGVKVSTIRSQLHRCYRELGVHTAGAAVVVAGREGWLPWRPGIQVDRRSMPRDPLPPFMAAYIVEFDRWIASRWSDDRARMRMRIALLGARY